MLVMVNIDTASNEAVPYIMEELMRLGAKNAHLVPCFTKKGRPGLILLVDVERENLEEIGAFLAGEFGNLGMRVFEPAEHIRFDYRICKIRLTAAENGLDMEIDVKVIRDRRGRITSARAEYEQLRIAASALREQGIALSRLKEAIQSAVLCGESRTCGGLTIHVPPEETRSEGPDPSTRED